MKFKRKSQKVMGSFVALHGKMPKSEQPARLRGKIPKGEVWLREDKWKSKKLRVHEKVELNLMDKGVSYRKAHRVANSFERNIHA